MELRTVMEEERRRRVLHLAGPLRNMHDCKGAAGVAPARLTDRCLIRRPRWRELVSVGVSSPWGDGAPTRSPEWQPHE